MKLDKKKIVLICVLVLIVIIFLVVFFLVKRESKDEVIQMSTGEMYKLADVDNEWNYSYYVDDSRIISVDKDGNVKAISDGFATVYIKMDDVLIGKKSFEVSDGKINSNKNYYELNTKKLIMNTGEKFTLRYSTNSLEELTATWSSSDPNIATVSNSGEVRAISGGDTIVYLMLSNGEKLECNIIVNDVNIKKGISFNYNNLSLINGDSFKIDVYNDSVDKTVIWSSSDSSVASVSDGVIRTYKIGKATIYAKNIDNQVAECVVNVLNNTVNLENISFDKSNYSMAVSSNYLLHLNMYPLDATNVLITWESSDERVVVVKDGYMTAKKEGKAIITAISSNGKKASCTVIVNSNVVDAQNISLSEKNFSLKVGESKKLGASITPSNTTNKTVTWSSSNTSVATVDNSGRVVAKGVGSSIISVKTNNGKKAEAYLMVYSDSRGNTTTIKISSLANTVYVGDSVKMTAMVTPSQGISWSSSNNYIAQISSDGTLLANSPGKVIITATSTDGKNVKDTYELNINTKSNFVVLKNDLIKKGSSVLYNVRLSSSSNTKVATVVDNQLKAINLGETTVKDIKGNSYLIKVVPSANRLVLKETNARKYADNLIFNSPRTSEYTAPQDFDIIGLGTVDEAVYFTFPYHSLLEKAKGDPAITSKERKELLSSYVYKATNVTSGSSFNISSLGVMYIHTTGQGQWIIKEPTGRYFYVSHGGSLRECTFPCTVWGGNNSSVARYIYSKNSYSDSPSPNHVYKLITNSSGNHSVFMAADWNNSLIAEIQAVAGTGVRTIKVYDANSFKSGSLNLVYSFTIPTGMSNGKSADVQGYALSNGYLYRYRSESLEGHLWIEQFDMTGKCTEVYEVSKKSFYSDYKNYRVEGQGIKAYGNKLYIGFLYRLDAKKNSNGVGYSNIGSNVRYAIYKIS